VRVVVRARVVARAVARVVARAEARVVARAFAVEVASAVAVAVMCQYESFVLVIVAEGVP
jgi:hypothetical protein